MSHDHDFRWPDEEPAPAAAAQAVRRALRAALVPADRWARAAGSRQRPVRRLRLRQLVRTRPLPLALAMAAGVASLAWALHGSGEGEPVAAWLSQDGRHAAAAAASSPHPRPESGRALGSAAAQPASAASAVAATTARAAAPQRGASPQWGEPLPPYRHLVEPTGASAFGPGLPPSPVRRTPGYTVSASEYLSGQEALRLARSQAPAVAAAGTPRGAAPRAERPLLLAGLADALGLSNVQDIPDGPSPAGRDTRVWTLADAAEQGLRHSPEVQAARARLAASREAAAPSSEPRWRSDLRRLRTAFGAAPATDDGPAPAARDADRGEIAQATLQATVADVGADVAQRYLATLQARVVLSLAQEHERQLLHLVGLVQARGGTLADEAGQLDRQADQAREQVLRARAALEASMQALSARVGDTPQRMLMDVPQPWRAPADLQAAMDTARQHSRTQRTQADLQSVYAQLQSMNSRHGALRAELAAQRRALSSARARLLADGRSLGELVDRYQAVHDRRVELATLMLGDAMGQVRVVQLTGQLPQAFAMADTRR